MRYGKPVLLFSLAVVAGAPLACTRDDGGEEAGEVASTDALSVVSAFEAESMKVTSGNVVVAIDSTASGGKSLVYWSDGVASKSVSTSKSTTSVVVRARGDQCTLVPEMTLAIDGKSVMTKSVSQTTWTDFTVGTSLAAGTHTFAVTFRGDSYVAGSCDGNLHVDKITLQGGGQSSTTGDAGSDSGSAGSSTQLFHATPAHAFVNAAGVSVRMNGVAVKPVWSGTTDTWGQDKYDQIAARGFNSVRFVLFWDRMEPTKGYFPTDVHSTLRTAVSRAKAAGLYVILNEIHLFGQGGLDYVPAWAKTGGDSVDVVRANGAPYLKKLAADYKNEPFVIAYDPVNEPYRWPIDNTQVLGMYDYLIKEMRSVDPDKQIHIEPTYGNTDMRSSNGCADWSALTVRTNVVLQFHDYFAGGDDDGFGSGCAAAGAHTYGGTTGYVSPNLAQLDAHVLAYKNAAATAGIPIYAGEYGIGDGVTNHDRWIQDTVTTFDKYDLGRNWWEYYTSGPLSAVTSSFTWKPWVGMLFAP